MKRGLISSSLWSPFLQDSFRLAFSQSGRTRDREYKRRENKQGSLDARKGTKSHAERERLNRMPALTRGKKPLRGEERTHQAAMWMLLWRRVSALPPFEIGGVSGDFLPKHYSLWTNSPT